eukprot:6956516-Prymnesium_polylepis.2
MSLEAKASRHRVAPTAHRSVCHPSSRSESFFLHSVNSTASLLPQLQSVSVLVFQVATAPGRLLKRPIPAKGDTTHKDGGQHEARPKDQ